ncbi:MAG: c-type cytochrome [Burkholderiales bacterium]
MKKLAGLIALLAWAACTHAEDAPQSHAAAAGQKVFLLCVGCHGDTPQHRPTGPHLFNIVGRQAGVLEGFHYSKALSESGIFWDERTLDEFIANAIQRVPGTFMAVGVPDEKDRADLIEYLKTLTHQ